MSLLGKIVSKILHPFGGGSAEAAPSESSNPTSTATTGSTASGGASAPAGGAPGGEKVVVEQVLNDMAA